MLTAPCCTDYTALAADVVQQPTGAGELAFEILGDTAAGLTIGSRAELIRKGVPESLVDALCEQLTNPVTFATGGGVCQTHSSNMRIYVGLLDHAPFP